MAAKKKKEAQKKPKPEPLDVNHILDRIANGESVRSIARSLGRNEASLRDRLSRDDVAAQSQRARELGIDSMADRVIEIADDLTVDPNHKRLMIDARLRLMGKWSQRYGDKQHIELSGSVETLSDDQVDARLSRLMAKQLGKTE